MDYNAIRRAYAHTTTRENLALATATGWKPPKPVQAALANLDRVRDLKPAAADHDTLTKLYGRQGFTRDDLDREAARVASVARDTQAWQEAQSAAATRLDRELRACVEDVIEHLRPKAEKALADIAWYAALPDPEQSVAVLLRAGRTEDAQRAAGIEAAWVELCHLRDVRKVCSPTETPWGILNWRNVTTLPDATEVPERLMGLDAEVYRIRKHGAVAWWPSWADAVAAHNAWEAHRRKLADDERLERQRIRQSAR